MRLIKILSVIAILSVALFFVFKPKEVKENVENTLPTTMYISELTSMRIKAHGKPNLPLTIGTQVEVLEGELEGEEDWVYISHSNFKGWVEKNVLNETKLEDKDIFETRKVLTQVPVEVDTENTETSESQEQEFEEKLVDTDISVKTLYDLGEVQFRSINKQLYPNNQKGDIKAIYISLNGMRHLDDYIQLAKETNINAFVLDVKNDYGRSLFESPTMRKALREHYIRPRSKDIKALIKKLKDNDIYLIGRISVFKDEAYVNANEDHIILDKRFNRAYESGDKIPWLDPYDRENWYYNVELAKEAADHGFNEILFDYVRFPDRVQNLEKENKLVYKNSFNETKSEVIQRFLKYAHDELSKKNVYSAASIFGQVGISKTDENLGQHWESISNVVDYVNPMAYPSHYAPNTYGLKNPDNNPYKLMNLYTKDVLKRNANLEDPALIETWIQGFSAPWIAGSIRYEAKELKEQIRALEEEGLNSYLVWNASSRYYWDGLK